MPEELPIIVLNRILNFYAATPLEAITIFGLVDKKNWNETVSKFGYDFWKRASDLLYGPSLRAHRHNAHSFKQRWLVTPRSVLANSSSPLASQEADYAPIKALSEVENCHENADFDFVCPITASGMTVTSEYTADHLRILFCKVCEKKVYPVKNIADFKKAQKEGRCVEISPEMSRAMIHDQETNKVEDQHKLLLPTTFVRKNIALVVSAASRESLSHGQRLLRRVHKESIDKHSGSVQNFLAADHLFLRCGPEKTGGDMPSVGVDLIQVDPKSAHPLEKLDNDNQPQGGYQIIFVLDSALFSMFDSKHLKKTESNTKLHAVLQAGHLVRHAAVGEATKKSSGSSSATSATSSVQVTEKDQDEAALVLILDTVREQVVASKPKLRPTRIMRGMPRRPPKPVVPANSKALKKNDEKSASDSD